MNIKFFSPEEHMSAVQNIEEKCFGHGFSNSTFFHFKQVLPEYFTVYEDFEIIGYCLGSISSVEKDIGWIVSIGILPEYQNNKIGSKLLIDMIDKLSRNVMYIRLTVNKENPAYDFYIKNGFYILKEPSDIYSNNTDSYLLEYNTGS